MDGQRVPKLEEMDEQQAGHFLTELGSALNPEEEYRIRHPEDYVMEMLQSGERFRGRENFNIMLRRRVALVGGVVKCEGSRTRRPDHEGGELMGRGFISRGFRGRRRKPEGVSGRVPPGQYLVEGFPVLSAGPTPRTPLSEWSFSVEGEVDEPRAWSWGEFLTLPSEEITRDIHCVTKWSKLDTTWEGVSVDTLLEGVDTAAGYVLAFCDGGYTTNLPLEEVTGGRAWVAHTYEGEPLSAEHGGPARLLVPHLYLWKSAKWVRGLRLTEDDEPGFWESLGYHNQGDPWREQRYWGD